VGFWTYAPLLIDEKPRTIKDEVFLRSLILPDRRIQFADVFSLFRNPQSRWCTGITTCSARRFLQKHFDVQARPCFCILTFHFFLAQNKRSRLIYQLASFMLKMR
jgi:hypothetical protein